MAMRPLPPDFKDFLQILNRRQVRYMVVGGWALGLHGWPRLTRDIDFWVAVDSDNASRIRDALTEFHAPGPIPEDFFSGSEKNIYFMGLPPTRIDLISAIDGVRFEECFGRSEVVEYEDIPIRVIGKEDFIKNKRASGRAKDIADAEELED